MHIYYVYVHACTHACIYVHICRYKYAELSCICNVYREYKYITHIVISYITKGDYLYTYSTYTYLLAQTDTGAYQMDIFH